MTIATETTNDVEGGTAQPTTGERGVALLWVAGLLVALLGVSAFAVDLGWLYLNTSRLQKAADAAALAGVVNLPALPTQADADAALAASANQFPIGIPVTNTFASEVLIDNKYEVTLGSSIGTFFLKVLGINSFNITRQATAQYVLPVPMGSPANCFGVGTTDILVNARWPGNSAPSNATGLCDNYTQNFWAAINGPQTAREHGDPYMPECIVSSGGNCTGTNPEFNRNDHYYYGIEVPANKTRLDVWVYDAGFYDRNNLSLETGDSELNQSSGNGADMTFTLKRPDATPHDQSDNIVHCTLSIPTGTSSSTYKNEWQLVCPRINNPAPGMWVLQVQTNGNDGGTNQYSLLTDTNLISAGSMPRLFGINDMGIFTNEDDGNATVWLAEILPVHAGKKLELRFFDPGEGEPPADMTVKRPDNSTATSCSWSADNGLSGTSCVITSTSGTPSNPNYLFNGAWITLIINIPSNYTCTASANGNSGCYWKMNLDLDVSHDRTTWAARVIGNPVRLVPNG